MTTTTEETTDGTITEETTDGTITTEETTDGTTTTTTTDTETEIDVDCAVHLSTKRWDELSTSCVDTCQYETKSYRDLSKGCQAHYLYWFYETNRAYVLTGAMVVVVLIVAFYFIGSPTTIVA